MGAYLIDRPPVQTQYAPRTNWSRSKITGCTVLHTSESVMDTVGPDTGAENVAAWIRGRADYGSYHDLVDADSGVWMVPYHLAAFHDGTGSNGWATSISFACKTSDWHKMSPEKRRGFLYQGALRFKAQQQWRKANGHPLTELRYITKAQSDAGASGFCCHGWRDPARRSDPGVAEPYRFPFDEWLDVCLEVMSPLAPPKEDEVTEADIDRIVQETADLVVLKLQRSDNSPADGVQPKQAMDSQVWTGMKRLEEKVDALLEAVNPQQPPTPPAA